MLNYYTDCTDVRHINKIQELTCDVNSERRNTTSLFVRLQFIAQFRISLCTFIEKLALKDIISFQIVRHMSSAATITFVWGMMPGVMAYTTAETPVTKSRHVTSVSFSMPCFVCFLF